MLHKFGPVLSFLIASAGLMLTALTLAATLDPAVVSQVQATTFEVVAAKPTTDPLSYEKPLPMDLLPFQERNDKYYSIGTAFSIGDNRYVTAAHVLNVGIGSLWGMLAIRDSSGHVYPVDKVEKFSLSRDFAVFSVTGGPHATALNMNLKPDMNSPVYAVGNALGTGVVIRDGLYTSKTPEEQDGKWDWIRFSAAASPGNSGGPLLDQSGAIIGVVLRKSQSENLNYALPIDEIVRAPEHLADIDSRDTYRLEIFDTVQSGKFTSHFALPLSYPDFSAAFLKLANAFWDTQLQALLAKDPDNLFPNGTGSSPILRDRPRMLSFPSIIKRESNGQWVMPENKGAHTSLPSNGYVSIDVVGHDMLFHVRRPDDMAAAKLYGDPQLLATLLLKTGFLQRTIGDEKVRVTDLGKPVLDSLHTDAWQRRWQVRAWPLPYANFILVTASLPVPDGYVTIARYAPAISIHESQISLEAITVFAYAGYWGTLTQWKDFLTTRQLLPAALQSVKLEFEYGRQVTFQSKRVSFSFDQGLQAIRPDNLLGVGFQYLDDDKQLKWDIGDVILQSDSDVNDYMINIVRHIEPSPDLDDQWRTSWAKIVGRQHPWDSAPYTENDFTKLTAIVDGAGSGQPFAVYSAYLSSRGSIPPEAMRAKLDLLLKTLRVETR